MSNSDPTGKIQITEVPDWGEEPLPMLEAFVGLVLPCSLQQAEGEKKGLIFGRPGFKVLQEEAIAALETENPVMAQQWKDRGYPKSGQYFYVADGEAAIVQGSILRELMLVID